MRKNLEEQMKLGEVDIAKLEFSTKSRDEIPQLLRGLQFICCQEELRRNILSLQEEHIGAKHNGRPGMNRWKILVLGVLRLNCNWNYDRLKLLSSFGAFQKGFAVGESNTVDGVFEASSMRTGAGKIGIEKQPHPGRGIRIGRSHGQLRQPGRNGIATPACVTLGARRPAGSSIAKFSE